MTLALNKEGEINFRSHARNGPELIVDGKIVMSNVAKEMRKAAEREDFENWLRDEKWKISKDEFDEVNNETFGMAISKMNANTHRFAMRYCYRWLPSGGRKNLNDPKEDHRCFMCGQTREDSLHFLKCRNIIAERSYKKMLEKIFGSLNEIEAPPIIRQSVMLNLKAWRDEKPIEREICETQRRIGWGMMLHGRISKEVSRKLVPNESDEGAINRKVAQLITAIIGAAKESWNTRCEAMAIDTGCRVAANRKMRLLRRADELRTEITAAGLGHVQHSTRFEMNTWKSDEIEIWIRNNERLVKK